MAKVMVQRKNACEHCTAGTCHITDDGAEIEGLNMVHAEVGQRVRVVMRPYTYLKGTLMVYGLPAIMLMVGAVVGKEFFAGMLGSLDPDLVSAIFAFGFFGLSFLLIKLWTMGFDKKPENRPVIEEVIPDLSENTE